jgi:hypothetical protein
MKEEIIIHEIFAIRDEIVQAFNAHEPQKILIHIQQSEELRYVEHIQITKGWTALKEGFEQWHKANQDLSIQIRQSFVNVISDQIAILISSGEIYQSGTRIQVMTWTAVFQNLNGVWKIVNAHETVAGV